jgi:hypothetical protein
MFLAGGIGTLIVGTRLVIKLASNPNLSQGEVLYDGLALAIAFSAAIAGLYLLVRYSSSR